MHVNVKVKDITGTIVKNGEIKFNSCDDFAENLSKWCYDNLTPIFKTIPYVRLYNDEDGIWMDVGSHSIFVVVEGLSLVSYENTNHPQMYVYYIKTGDLICDTVCLIDAVGGKYYVDRRVRT